MENSTVKCFLNKFDKNCDNQYYYTMNKIVIAKWEKLVWDDNSTSYNKEKVLSISKKWEIAQNLLASDVNNQKNITIHSTTPIDVVLFDENDVKTLTALEHTQAMQHNTTYKVIQDVEDVLQRAKAMWIVSIPYDIQTQLWVTLENERNWYYIDYATKSIVPLIYLPLSERTKWRGIGTKLLQWMFQDGAEKLAFAGGVHTIIDTWSHGTTAFDHNTNLDCVDAILEKWVCDVDAILSETPLVKMITREWFSPDRIALRIEDKHCEHVIMWYTKKV